MWAVCVTVYVYGERAVNACLGCEYVCNLCVCVHVCGLCYGGL